MAQTMASDSRGSSPSVQMKIRSFLMNMKSEMDRPVANLAFSELKVTYSAKNAMRLSDPKYAVIYATSIMVQKAMLAAGITTDEERRNCVQAIGNLAGDFSLAAALGPETAGFGAILPLFAALMDSYDMANCCFQLDGRATHAVVAGAASKARQAEEMREKIENIRKK